MTKRLTALLLAALLLLGCLSGCGKQSAETDAPVAAKSEAPAASNSGEKTSAVSAKFAYQAQYIDLPVENGYVGRSCFGSDAFYYITNVQAEESGTDETTGESYSYDTWEEHLFRLDLTTQAVTDMGAMEAAGIPEGWEGNSYVSAMTAGFDDTLWLVHQSDSYRFNLPEGFDEATQDSYDYYEEGESSYVLKQLDAQGKELQSIELTQLAEAEDNYGVYYLFVDSNGYVYAGNWEQIYVWDKEGQFVMELDTSEMGSEFMQYSPTEVGALDYSAEELSLKVIDPQTKGWGASHKVPDNAYIIFPGNDSYTFYYDYNGKIFGYNEETDESEKILDWMECDIDSNNLQSENYRILPDGRALVLLQSNGENADAPQLAILNPVDPATLPEKIVLSLGCFYLDYQLRSKIVNFNRASQEYRIVVKDYSEQVTDMESYEAAITKLNTEILSGKGPDILLTANMPVRQYAARGILTDLQQFIDADESIKPDDLLQPVLKACTVDGKLYTLPQSFSINTLLGLDKVVGQYADNWNLDTMLEAKNTLPEGASIFGDMSTKETVLQMCVLRGLDQYVNWDTGEVRFDSPEFISMLEFANQFPADFDSQNFDWNDYESDYKRMREGRQLLGTAYLSGFGDINVMFTAMDDQPCFVGYPVGPKHGLSLNTAMAISEACPHKDAAWAFVRSVVLDTDERGVWDFPVSRKAFEAAAAEAMEKNYEYGPDGEILKDENGQPIEVSKGGYGFSNDEMYEVYAMTQEQYDKVMELIESCDTVAQEDQNITTLISEETAAFFAGEKSAADTAKAIQSRVNLYVAEQR